MMSEDAMQLLGMLAIGLLAGIAIGVHGLKIVQEMAKRRTAKDSAVEEQVKNYGLCAFGRYA